MRMHQIREKLKLWKRRLADTEGQALIETAIFSCLFVFMAAMAADAAWMAYAGAVTSSAARQAAVFAAQGQKSTAGAALNNGSLYQKCSAASNEMFEWGGYTNAPVLTINMTATSLNATSWTYYTFCSASTYYAQPPFQADPEAAYFTIDAAQINAGFNPPVPFKFPGIKWLSVPTEIHGHPAYMRQLN